MNQNATLTEFSSKVELNMAFPYSQSPASKDEVPLRRQTYQSGAAPMKVQKDVFNGTSQKDGLVQSTVWGGKSASMKTNGSVIGSYRVEHLASFQNEVGKGAYTPATGLKKLKSISGDGGLWTQVMNMKISNDRLIMANGDTMEVIETYLLERVNLCTHISNDPIFPHLFIFSTKLSEDKVGAIHLFRCKSGEAAEISTAINKARDEQVKTVAAAVTNGGYAGEIEAKQVNGHESPEPLKAHSHGVSQRVEALQKIVESPPVTAGVTRSGSKNAADYPHDDFTALRVNRDVGMLNRCIDEIENFIIQLKGMNEARKTLTRKGNRKSTKKKYDKVRLLASGPTETALADIYRKFKFSFNMLGRLRPHIRNPNAPELVHYLMVPLDIVVKVNGIKTAQSVMSPWLTTTAIDFLSSCLYTKELEFWKLLGPNWNLPQSAPIFNDKHMAPYVPVFHDGWVPPEIVTDDRNAAAAKSAANMVARMKIVEEEEEMKKKAAMQESKVTIVSESQTLEAAPQKTTLVSPEKGQVSTGTGKFASVVYDYWAHNNKELTIRAGDKVLVLDDSRRWWLVKNDDNEQGYVPSTVLEFVNPDANSDSSSADGSTVSANSPSSTGYFSGSGKLDLGQVRPTSLGKLPSEPNSPTVITARSIITESAQFSNPSSPREPAPPVFPKPQSSVKRDVPPSFVPAPPTPPVITPPSPVVIVQSPEVKELPGIVVQAESKPESLQSELETRLNTTQATNGNSLQASEGVDFFIPLFKSSTADDVSRWLRKLNFDPITIERLKGTTAKELFQLQEADILQRLGPEEGARLYEELQVQVGAQTRHKTMTEFQKALVHRIKRQETIQKNIKQHHVVVQGPSGPGTSLSQEDMQKKFLEQQAMLKSQQNTEGSEDNRKPDKPSFSSFTGPSSPNNNQFDYTSSSAQ